MHKKSRQENNLFLMFTENKEPITRIKSPKCHKGRFSQIMSQFSILTPLYKHGQCDV